MHIQRSDSVPAFASPHGEVVYELVGNKAGSIDGHSLAQIVLPPGKASRKHYHPVAEETFYVLSGRGRITVGEETRDIVAGDTVFIPAEAVHQVQNHTNGQANLVFLAVCVPAWTPDNSVYLD